MGKVFYYEGHKFEAIGNILGGWNARAKCVYYKKDEKPILEVEHNAFYKVARKNRASCDVYKIDDRMLVMSCSGKFRPVKIDNAHFKRCEEYSKWYQ